MDRSISTFRILALCAALLLTACGGRTATVAQEAPVTASEFLQDRSARRQPAPTHAHAAAEAAAALAAPADNTGGFSTGGDAIPNGEPYDSTYYQNYGTNPFIDTEDDLLSTFAMDVDTASYGVMRRYIADGHLPDPDSVRVEEYFNYFDYNYPEPEADHDFAISTEIGPSPFGGERYEMIQIGIQGRTVQVADRKPASLTFVVDVSGSMEMENRLETVKQALALLVGEMREDDTIAIAVYGSEARRILEPTSGANKSPILQAINRLAPDGSTNVEAGLDIGFDLADQAYSHDRINMVLLCSDGVANNGVTDAEGLLDKYEPYTDKGIQLSTFGFGMGNFNDILMEGLANAGDGSYAYIDTLDEAQRVFLHNLTGTLQTIARDAKIQVEFNPAVVSRYRLLGYENRDVADEDFRNDQVDAGEVGAGHSVTALYEIKRVPDATGPIATVRIRYQQPEGEEVVEEASTLATDAVRRNIDETTPRFKLALSVAQYAEILRNSYWAKDEALDDAQALAQAAARGLENDEDVAEFVSLLSQATALVRSERE